MFACLPPSALPGISPSRGEIGCGSFIDPHWSWVHLAQTVTRDYDSRHKSISPLEGEMPGRAEGGIASVTSEVTHGR